MAVLLGLAPQVAVKIDGLHVVHSPATLILTSTRCDLTKSVVTGEGLEHVVKLEKGSFRIAFRDEYGNAILQDAAFKEAVKAGMALTSHGQRGESLSKNA